jgi:hypothetical protein
MRSRRKAQDKARRERDEKRRVEAEQPDVYHHPSPFNTNPYWSEEINMGPSLPRKGGSKNNSQRGLTSAGRDSSTTGISVADTNSTVILDDGTLSGEGWNKKRYQREDEELWGHDITKAGKKLMDAIVEASSTAGRLFEATLGKEKPPVTDEDRHAFYLSPKNPPVNDYHPPVVSVHPSHRDAHRWMLQPPPPAKVMEGKIPVSRTGSSSGSMTSRRNVSAEEPQQQNLGRLMRERLVKAKIRKGETPSESELIDSLIGISRRTTGSTLAAFRTRSRSLSAGSDESEEFGHGASGRRWPRARPVPAPVDTEGESEEDEGVALPKISDSLGKGCLAGQGHATQRPMLETILSSNSNGSRRTGSTLSGTGPAVDVLPKMPQKAILGSPKENDQPPPA